MSVIAASCETAFKLYLVLWSITNSTLLSEKLRGRKWFTKILNQVYKKREEQKTRKEEEGKRRKEMGKKRKRGEGEEEG